VRAPAIPTSLAGLKKKLMRLAQSEEDLDAPPKEVLRPEFLAGLKRLDLRAKALLRGFLQGFHRTPRKGFSAEFSDYREFVAGDDSRWIDWRLFARTDRLYIKRFEAESALRATLVLDGSASMAYRSGARMGFEAPIFSKLGYGATLAAAFAYLLQHQRDRVGLLVVGGGKAERPQKSRLPQWLAFLNRPDRKKRAEAAADAESSGGLFIPPRSSRHHVREVVQALSAVRAAGTADLPEALKQLALQERRRGMVVIITDGLYGREHLLDALRRLRHRGHDVILFQVWDPEELDPPMLPGIGLRDPETLERFEPSGREEYVRRAHTHLAEVRQGALGAGCEYQLLLTTTAFDRALLKFLRLRKQKR